MDHDLIPLFVTIPHSGEEIPPEAKWLKGLPETVLMGDVDRYVDVLYEDTLKKLKIPFIKTQWHRYAADLNRLPTDVDCESVQNHPQKAGAFPRGFHWVYSTQNEKILKEPLTPDIHQNLVDRVYHPFHARVKNQYSQFEQKGFKKIYHLDLHSMPSLGTNQHRDPGQRRADVVISDLKGKSCEKKFLDLVGHCYQSAGLKIAYNWPYFGGRLTEQYGQPELGHHVIQIELNRALYMNETSKKWNSEKAPQLQKQLHAALTEIQRDLQKWSQAGENF